MTPEQIAKSGTEESHQTALFAAIALDTEYPQLKLAFAIPNGGLRNKVTAGKLKAQGVKAGVFDIFLPVARGGYHGCWLEMKVGNNTLSQNQVKFLAEVRGQGYASGVAYTWEGGLHLLQRYLRSEL